ncbi:MAG: hypothetical protein ACYDD7_22460 [Acidimicrobiales bacterium]
MPAHPLEVTVEPFGPSQEAVQRASETLLTHPTITALLGGSDRRLLGFRLLDEPDGDNCCQPRKGSGRPPSEFAATVYDYAEDRVLEVTGPLSALDGEAPDEVAVTVMGYQPLPTEEEFQAAVDVVRRNRELRAQLERGEVEAFRPMPPVVLHETPDGRVERTVTVGLRTTGADSPVHEIVGVRMFDATVLRDIPHLPQRGERVCEPPPAQDAGGASAGTAGQCWITVTSGGQTLWRFLAIRPAASSGTNGSGIELRDVDYKGKRVLYQAHVPILNVEYGADGQQIGCGPTYRDWENSEKQFQAQGTTVAPGFILCPQPAQTIIDSDSDQGTFSGVAIFVDGQEVVLVSEFQAGWYRYISEWRFHANGTLRPRFGFAGTENRCTCHLHTHHVYWRLDFDLRTPGHNTVEEYNDPPIVANQHWHTKRFEICRPRDAAHHRRWRVRNAASGETYEIVPGPHDGDRTAYGVGDLWVLRYHPGEIDDGQGFTTDANLSRAHLEKFMTPPESVEDTDVVVWYAAHYVHDAGVEVGNWVGPDLIPTVW